MKKEDYIKQLHEDPLFKLALSKAETPEQEDKVRRMTEAFVLKFGTIMERVYEQIQNDPDFKTKLRKALIERNRVVTSGPAVTGSRGS